VTRCFRHSRRDCSQCEGLNANIHVNAREYMALLEEVRVLREANGVLTRANASLYDELHRLNRDHRK
jgi:hypothetical protein